MTANSPGEISGWLAPVLAVWRGRYPDSPVVVILLPCTFATGSEASVASRLAGVERVVPVSDFFSFLLREGARYRGCPLLHLGGDLMYTAFLSWRWKLRSYAYLWARPWWDSALVGYFAKDSQGAERLLRRRVAPSKIKIVGDLVVDSVAQKVGGPQPTEPYLISFLPGSRDKEAASLVPFFLGVAERLREWDERYRFQLHLSPYLTTSLRSSWPVDPAVGGSPGQMDGTVLTSAQGVKMRIFRERSLAQLARARLAVSIPGTKTAEAGSLGVPVLSILPLNRPQDLPYIGLIGLLDWVPGGTALKSRLLLRMRDTIELLAQPNQLAGEPLIPELIEVIEVDPVASLIDELIRRDDQLERVRARLLSLYAPYHGAAEQMVSTLALSSASPDTVG